MHSLPDAAGHNFQCGFRCVQNLPQHRAGCWTACWALGRARTRRARPRGCRAGAVQPRAKGNGTVLGTARGSFARPGMVARGTAAGGTVASRTVGGRRRQSFPATPFFTTLRAATGRPAGNCVPYPIPVGSILWSAWSEAEVSVVPGKVNDRLARFAGDGARMLILRRVAHPVLHRFAPREQVVPVSLLPCPRPLVCLAACLAAVWGGELLVPFLVPQWILARSHVPVGEWVACQYSCQAGRLLLWLAFRWGGAVPSIRPLPGKAQPQAWK